jgi:uncharacterized protein
LCFFDLRFTLDDALNPRHAPFAVVNLIDDVRVFAGCLPGRRDWPLTSTRDVAAPRLASTLTHLVLVVVEAREHEPRPFQGLNRAQAAVIDGAVLVSLTPVERCQTYFSCCIRPW